MTLKQLLMFTTVCRHGSFSQAAGQLNIVQPALSRQIANLEAELGAELVNRSSRPIKPTDEGLFILERAQKILDGVERLKFELAAKLKQQGTQVTVGFVGSALASELPRYLRALRERDPDIHLNLREMTSIEQIDALKEGRIIAGFGRLYVDDNAVEQIVLGKDSLVVALPPTHRLAAGNGPVELDQLQTEPVILYPAGKSPNYTDRVLSELRRRGVALKHVTQVSDLHCALGLVAANTGLSIVPHTAIGNHPEEIVFKKIAGDQVYSPVIMNIRRDDNSRELALLVEAVSLEGSAPDK